MSNIYLVLTVFDENALAITSHEHIQHSSGKGKFYRWERRQLLLHLDTQVPGLRDEKAEFPGITGFGKRASVRTAAIYWMLKVNVRQCYRKLC